MSKSPGTEDRVIAAATELFAERGFHATTIRAIADRAGVNLASAHYHHGSKKALYQAVLRRQFAEIWRLFERRRARRSDAELDRMPRSELASLLEARIAAMLDVLIGPPPGVPGTLMQREMTDPSEALPMIVEEFIRPMKAEMAAIVSRLAPALDREGVERCVYSIIGQTTFFRFSMPVILTFLGRDAYPRGFTKRIAAHIARFSLGGMRAVAGEGS